MGGTKRQSPAVAWEHVEHVMLDMDGTLLDLHFDNHFWLEHLPFRYAELNGLPLEVAKERLYARFQAVRGTLNWYCLDFWNRELALDLPTLKREVADRIAVHPEVIPFLDTLRASHHSVWLVTNAHPASLALKMERTALAGHFDRLITSHELGAAKESQLFWQRLEQTHPFQPAAALMVDDNVAVLEAARDYGIGQCIAVRRPDSRGPERESSPFAALDSFADIMPPFAP